MSLSRSSPAKVNLLLNVLGRRSDGFHELETVLFPLKGVADEISVTLGGHGIRVTCSDPRLPTDAGNLVYRAAAAFVDAAKVGDGVAIHLEKRVPLESGMGGGSSNAATTLMLLNELHGGPLRRGELELLAMLLGSDVPFFLYDGPALGTGRGEKIELAPSYRALEGTWIFLVHPGFGVPTPWAYQQLKQFPSALNGEPGRARRLLENLQQPRNAHAVGAQFYNALEGPVHSKYPILMMYQDHLRRLDPIGILMSGSGSTTFSVWPDEQTARRARETFVGEFGDGCWTSVVPL